MQSYIAEEGQERRVWVHFHVDEEPGSGRTGLEVECVEYSNGEMCHTWTEADSVRWLAEKEERDGEAMADDWLERHGRAWRSGWGVWA